MLEFENFAVLPEETHGILGVVQFETEDKRSLFALRILEERVTIPGPGRGENISGPGLEIVSGLPVNRTHRARFLPTISNHREPSPSIRERSRRPVSRSSNTAEDAESVALKPVDS